MKILSLSFLLIVTVSSFKNLSTEIKTAKQLPVKDFIQVYQTPESKGSITIHSANQSSLSFYLFDLEGKLIYQTKIKTNEKQTVDGLTNGVYLYNAFENDKNLEGGKVILK